MDGRPARVVRVDDVLRGVVVGRGRHVVVWSYAVPGLRAVRSPQLARQVLGRGRIAPMVWRLTRRFGSRTCAQACA